MAQRRLTKADVDEIVSRVRFKDRRLRVLEKGDGFLVQLEYEEPDIEHPERGPVLQRSRKWYVSSWSTETEVVETCFAAVCRSQLHVAGEHFTYEGRRIYSPHLRVGARLQMCDERRFDQRQPKEAK
jgi:hypothetical protein